MKSGLEHPFHSLYTNTNFQFVLKLLWAAWLRVVQYDAELHSFVDKRFISPMPLFAMLQFLRLFTLREEQVGARPAFHSPLASNIKWLTNYVCVKMQVTPPSQGPPAAAPADGAHGQLPRALELGEPDQGTPRSWSGW